MPTAKELIAYLKLQPHPKEGGFFRETYRADEGINAPPARYPAPRSFCTAIYYLLTPDTFSAMHRVASDEIFHFYLGDPVRMLQLDADGQGRTLILGSDILHGQQPQVVVRRGIWQGSILEPGGSFALFGCTASPGFDYADYETGRREPLLQQYPIFADLIQRLTVE
jgi:predicted cupin superfamily sugar epimerase